MKVVSESAGDPGVAGSFAVPCPSPAPGLGVGLQALDIGELIADGVTEFGAVTKFSQLSQMLEYGQAPAASYRER